MLPRKRQRPNPQKAGAASAPSQSQERTAAHASTSTSGAANAQAQAPAAAHHDGPMPRPYPANGNGSINGSKPLSSKQNHKQVRRCDYVGKAGVYRPLGYDQKLTRHCYRPGSKSPKLVRILAQAPKSFSLDVGCKGKYIRRYISSTASCRV